jgi:peptidoglycan/xylan/chitin deacetylase (PgdA/CDA1 family)
MKIPAKLNAMVGDVIRKKWNKKGQSAVIYFHRVLTAPNPYFPDDPTVEELDLLLTILGECFRFASLQEIATRRCVTNNEKPMLGISFDDGYEDNYTHALPVLEKHGVKATFFVSSAGTREGILWQDKIIQCVEKVDGNPAYLNIGGDNYSGLSNLDIASNLMRSMKRQKVAEREQTLDAWVCDIGLKGFDRIMMTEKQIKTLADKGHHIGGHTHNHAILSAESIRFAKSEITENKEFLERVIQRPINLFCYPNGHPQLDINLDVHPQMLKEAGYIAAFTTLDGGIGMGDDPMLLPRFLPYRKNPYLRAWSAGKIAGENVW